MPLLARLRQLFDLDAEPAVVDAHLAQNGLASLVRRRPGIRIPGALDGFEVALRIAAAGWPTARGAGSLLGRVVEALGEQIDTGIPSLTRLAPTPERVAEAGAGALEGWACARTTPRRSRRWRAHSRQGRSGWSPGRDVAATHRALVEARRRWASGWRR